MRINIYAEELTQETAVVTKRPTGGTVDFYGIRMFIESPSTLHHTPDDDDRSAITFWIPWTKRGGHNYEAVESVLEEMLERVRELATNNGHVMEPHWTEPEC